MAAEKDTDWEGLAKLVIFVLIAIGGAISNWLKKKREASQVTEMQRELQSMDAAIAEARAGAAQAPVEARAIEIPVAVAAPAEEEAPPAVSEVPERSLLARAILWREILQPPVSLRRPA